MNNKIKVQLHIALQQSDTPLVRWGLVVVGIIFCWALLLSPYLDWRKQQLDLVVTHARQAAKLQLLLTSTAEWHAANMHAEAELKKWLPRLFRSHNEASAQAELADTVLKLAQARHLVLQSQRLLEPEQHGVLQRVMVLIILHGQRPDLFAFMDAVAHSNRLIVMDRVDINSHAATKDTQIRCRISGFRWVGGGA